MTVKTDLRSFEEAMQEMRDMQYHRGRLEAIMNEDTFEYFPEHIKEKCRIAIASCDRTIAGITKVLEMFLPIEDVMAAIEKGGAA